MSYADLARVVQTMPSERPLAPGVKPINSPFRAPWTRTVKLLEHELRMVGARRATTILELDMDRRMFRLDGLPRADARPRGSGVALSFTARGHGWEQPVRYEVGTYSDWQENLRAIALSLEALRSVDRYGVTRKGEQYAGWRQLPSGDGATVDRGFELIRRYGTSAAALRATHPDTRQDGHTDADFRSVQLARGTTVP